MINRKSIVNSPDDRLRQFNRMPIPKTHTCTHTHNHTRFWPNSQNTATLHTFLHTYPPVHSWWFAQVIAVVERLENKLPLSLPGWLTSTSFQYLSLSLLC